MKVALIGNPNCGKSSLFNHLTGLRQKIGNFPGVTVDKKVGFCKISDGRDIQVIDLPGTYSLYPNSLDEQVVLEVLTNQNHPDFPSLAVIVVDSSNLKRNLLLFEEVNDLGIPTILALNMLDVANEIGITINTPKLEKLLGVPVIEVNAREGIGVEGLKLTIFRSFEKKSIHHNEEIIPEKFLEIAAKIKEKFRLKTLYAGIHFLAQNEKLSFLKYSEKEYLKHLATEVNFDTDDFQAKEVISRYKDINATLSQVVEVESEKHSRLTFTQKVDNILIHRVWGYVVFLGILFFIFQAVFTLASYPMDWIDTGISTLNEFLRNNLPNSRLTDLLTEGLVAGVGGVMIFIPQIAFLFTFISVLEESGYMARVVVLMDRLIRKFGLSGKSVVPLISGLACAVPAIMSARTIGNWKDRLITIMVTPLMSCSARLPIYTILIAMVVPDTKLWGLFGFQGLVLMGLYFLGFFGALAAGWVMKKMLKTQERNYFVMELPTYKKPRWKQVGFTILEKVKTFTFEAGKIIIAISIVLWVLASYGPGEGFNNAENRVKQQFPNLNETELDHKIASEKLQNSYAGIFGKVIEPVIKPLGYDWKIGIALITSFAAREVFVGTISTIYSIGSDDDATIKERLKREINPVTGKPVFSTATSYSLLMFYVFAMMCMSTIAVVYRETKSWKWPMIQLAYMSVLAYVSAWLVYVILR
ncbi:MAG: ferrous iron transport protein B [Cytophagaceae bacterium]|nr:ferrous iron transport protein B [Cytophagaceae bacterium]MBK9933197.1 ferrous iron transport protein B [Cytophagaceae bacterium]MBL0303085.1 ferrous iron transport protein B [Cytophagaceae bacterium]MBL0325930.1 ferrous iron transport protein B [Cytophagaceae bacterium]